MTSSSLATALLASLAMVATPADDTPIRVKLSDDYYVNGDHARIRVKPAKDGYLVVLRVNSEGQVRVIFPVDPGKDAAVKGGKEFEVRSRGGRDAFTVNEKKGTGLVIAALADGPFNFGSFVTGEHWNFDALVPRDSSSDPEAALLSVLDRMGDGHYDYDAVTYSVDNFMRRPGYGPVCGMYDSFCASPFGYTPFYRPWPWLYGPHFGATVVIPIRPFHGRRR